MTCIRDLVRQGHPTFDLTFPISGPNKARVIVFFVSKVFLGQGTQKKKKKYRDSYA